MAGQIQKLNSPPEWINIKQYIDPMLFNKILFKATVLPIVLSILICGLFIQQFSRVNEQNNQVHNADLFLANNLEVTKSIIDSETGLRGFLITGNEEFLGPWDLSLKKHALLMDKLKKSSMNDPYKLKSLEHIISNYEQWLENASKNIQNKRMNKEIGSLESFQLRKNQMDDIRATLDDLYSREQTKRKYYWDESQRVARQALQIIIACGVLLGSFLAFLSFNQLKHLSINYNLLIDSLTKATEHLEETVALRTQDLKAVNEELEAFSYSVSHDLRAPLRGIDGFSQILMDEYAKKLDGEATRYLNFIRQGVQKMGLLIDDLINLSRLTRSEFKLVPVDISLIAEEIMQELLQQDPNRKYQFKNFDSEIVNADAGLLKIALMNLLSNAWKYSAPKEISIIELGKKNENGKNIFFVKDNGVGFDMKYADKLFQPFQRLHSRETFTGTGIGLTTVSRIIKRHGGRIWAESVEGDGSIFNFTLN